MNVITFLVMQTIVALSLRYAYAASAIAEKHRHGETKVSYNKRSRIVLLVVYALYIVFAISRKIDLNIGGTDAYNYREFYMQAYCSFAEFSAICTQEIGFRFLMWIFRQMNLDFRVFLLLIHTVSFVSVCHFNKYCYVRKENLVSFLCTFALSAELFTVFSMMRNGMAIAFALWFFVLMGKKRYGLAILPLAAALSVHISSVILVAMYIGFFVLEKAKATTGRRIIFWVALACLAEIPMIFVIHRIARDTKYYIYIGQGGMAWGVYAILLVVTATIYYKFEDLQNNHRMKADAWILFFGWCCLPLQLYFAIMHRMLLFFLPMMYKVIPYLFDKLGPFPLQINLRRPNIKFLKDEIPRIQIRRDNFWKIKTYLPLAFKVFQVAMLGYLLIRCWKIYTTDFVSYGVYSYIFEWFH